MALVSLATASEAAEDHGAAAGHHGGSLIEDVNLWVTLGFLTVVGIVIMAGVPKTVGQFFRGRADSVRSSLDDARSVREEAQRTLADFQKRQRDAEGEAEAIIEQAKADAKNLAAEARAKLDDQLARRQRAAEERIARAEAQAVAATRGQTADLAIAAAKTIIEGRVDDKAHGALLDKAIADVRGKLN
ncbi:MAG: F0F1 ATP synthase subunit B family protein [Parvularcula sp.]